MIFALTDFLQWKLRRGRYGEGQTSVMSLGFEGMPPRDVVRSMLPGDAIFTQRLDAWFSWMMMYFSSSPIDHCAIYAGEGKVIHQTFTVCSEDPLRYVAKGARVLVCRPVHFGIFAEARSREPSLVTRFFHRYPAKVQLTWAAVEFALGFYPERFRWRFVGDFIVLSAAIDLLLYPVASFPVCSSVAFIILTIALGNQLRWLIRRVRNVPPPLPASHPDLLLKPFFRGGLMLTTLGPLLVAPFGLLPLKAARTIASGASSDSEAAAFQTMLREMLRELDVLEEAEEGS